MSILTDLLALAASDDGAILVLCGLALPFLRPNWFGLPTD